MVNRVWHHLFGQGLVSTVDNFGVTGDVPSHPELLDYLATRFIRDGWSVKKLVRTLVLTRAYQLELGDAGCQLSPSIRPTGWSGGTARGGSTPRRFATPCWPPPAQLDLARPTASPAKDLKVMELRNNGPEAKRLDEAGLAEPAPQRLSAAAPRPDAAVAGGLRFRRAGMVTGSRDTTTVPPRPCTCSTTRSCGGSRWPWPSGCFGGPTWTTPAASDLAYRLTLGRLATAREIERATSYLADYEAASRSLIAAARAQHRRRQTADPQRHAEPWCQLLPGRCLESAEYRFMSK